MIVIGVQMPTQPLLCPAALVDEIVAVIDEQLEITEDGFVGPGSTQVGLSQRRPGDRERVIGPNTLDWASVRE